MRGRAKEFHSVALLNNIVCNNVCNCCLELSGKCLISSVLSRHNKRWSDEPALQLSDRPVSQLHFTAQFHLENKGKYILEAWGHKNPKTQREEREHPRRRETPGLLAPLFICCFCFCFVPPPALPYVNWASQECCLLHLRSPLWSLDLPLFYFWSFPLCLFAAAILDSFFLF